MKSLSERLKLPAGSQLLIPKRYRVSVLPRREKAKQPPPDLTTGPALALAKLLKQSVLYKDDDLLVINKPAGLAVQGGPGVKLSLDQVMGSALCFGSQEHPRYDHTTALMKHRHETIQILKAAAPSSRSLFSRGHLLFPKMLALAQPDRLTQQVTGSVARCAGFVSVTS